MNRRHFFSLLFVPFLTKIKPNTIPEARFGQYNGFQFVETKEYSPDYPDYSHINQLDYELGKAVSEHWARLENQAILNLPSGDNNG